MALDRLTKVDGTGIHTLSNIISHNINSSGIVTATKFVGPVEGSITATDATFSGNVSIAGTLTYEDVTNVDSVGLITAREGIHIPDNKRLDFGGTAGDGDFEIRHTSGNTFIENNTGSFFISQSGNATSNPLVIHGGSELQLKHYYSNGGQLFALKSVRGYQTEIYWQGQKKIETTSKGILVGTGVTIETNGQAEVAGITTFYKDVHIKSGTNRLYLGTSDQLSLIADPSHSYLRNAGNSSHFQIHSNNFGVRSYTGNGSITLIYAPTNDGSGSGGVQLWHNNGSGINPKRFQTTNQGIEVLGHSELDNVSIAGITTIAQDQELVFGSNADSQLTGRIKQLSGSSPSMQITSKYPRINAHDFRIHKIGTSDHYAYFWNNEVALFSAGTKRFSTLGHGITVYGNGNSHGIKIENTTHKINITGDTNRPGADNALVELDGRWNNTQVAYITLSTGDDTTNKDDGRIGFFTKPSGGTIARRVIIQPSGNVEFNHDIDVDGHTNLDNVSIAGVSTFSGNADFSSGVDVTGNVTSTGNVVANGTMTVGSYGLFGSLVAADPGSNYYGPTNRFGGGLALAGELRIDGDIVHIGDTDTKIRFPANDTFTVETAGTERLRIHSNGRTVIGGDASGTQPSATVGGAQFYGGSYPGDFRISSGAGASGTSTASIAIMGSNHNASIENGANSGAHLNLYNYNTTDGNSSGVMFMNSNGLSASRILGLNVSHSSRTGALVFMTSNGSHPTEKMRLDKDGSLGIGNINPGAHVHIDGGTSGVQQLRVQNHSSIGTFDGNYGSEFRHATSAANHAMLIHCHEAQDNRRTLDISSQNGIFASFTNGKFGLGTTGPKAKLDVRGNAIIADDIGTVPSTFPPANTQLLVYTSTTGQPITNTNCARLCIATDAKQTGAQGYNGAIDFGNSDVTASGSNAQYNWRVASIMSNAAGDTGNDPYADGDLQFWTKDSNGSLSQRVTITAAGRFAVNETSPSGIFHVRGAGNSDADAMFFESGSGGTAAKFILMTNDNSDRSKYIQHSAYWTEIGCHNNEGVRFRESDGDIRFYMNGASGNYNFTGSNISDRNLKENIETITTNSIDLIKQVVPRTFNWKHDRKNIPHGGFIAQEMQPLFPKLINGVEYDESRTDDGDPNEPDAGKCNPTGMGFDYNGYTAYLTKAMQELIAKVEALEAEVASLKGS